MKRTSISILFIFSVVSAHSQAAQEGSPSRPSYSLTISTNGAQFHSGEQIKLRIVTKNISDQPLLGSRVIPQDNADLAYRIFVYDETGGLATETAYGRRNRTGKGEKGEDTISVFHTSPLKYLLPGESEMEEANLNKLYNLSKPGRYTIQIRAIGDTAGIAKSNTVTVTIR